MKRRRTSAVAILSRGIGEILGWAMILSLAVALWTILP